uniref:Methyltransferase type 11 domain-containing protein n=1 Tax=Biomphalaria glabrata TaxID=6526 RepID=A0A2C9KNZ4_BIOGL
MIVIVTGIFISGQTKQFYRKDDVNVARQTIQDDVIHIKKQRDILSRLLNQMKQMYGQQNCQMMKLQKNDSKVSANGGWCEETGRPNSKSHITDPRFATALSRFLTQKTVGSFGDGPGTYKELLHRLGHVKSYSSFDGAPFCDTVTGGLVSFLDLTAPQYGLPIFDWVVSIEVAEHIPAKFEEIYLDNLARHAREGIILSWAVPGQKGLSHVNNKPLADVIKEMSKRGFHIDVQAGEPLRKASLFGWLRSCLLQNFQRDFERAGCLSSLRKHKLCVCVCVLFKNRTCCLIKSS